MQQYNRHILTAPEPPVFSDGGCYPTLESDSMWRKFAFHSDELILFFIVSSSELFFETHRSLDNN
jgi:hypothetical protein